MAPGAAAGGPGPSRSSGFGLDACKKRVAEAYKSCKIRHQAAAELLSLLYNVPSLAVIYSILAGLAAPGAAEISIPGNIFDARAPRRRAQPGALFASICLISSALPAAVDSPIRNGIMMYTLVKLFFYAFGSPLGSDSHAGKIYVFHPMQMHRQKKLFSYLTFVRDAIHCRAPRALGDEFYSAAFVSAEAFIMDSASRYGGAVLCFRVHLRKVCKICDDKNGPQGAKRVAHFLLAPLSFDRGQVTVRACRN